jgi:hypothetical protein
MKASRHQNLVGWDNFLRGYISIYWRECQILFYESSSHRRLSSETWDTNLIKAIVTLYTSLWKDRNRVLHGSTRKEASILLRSRVLNQVRQLYKHPPQLAGQYSTVRSVPLEDRLKHSTTLLQRWLKRVHHQVYMSKFLKDNSSPCQPTTKQAFAQVSHLELTSKYPP